LDSAVELLLSQQVCKKTATSPAQDQVSGILKQSSSSQLASIFTSTSHQRSSQQVPGKDRRKLNNPTVLKSRSFSQGPPSGLTKSPGFVSLSAATSLSAAKASIQSEIVARNKIDGSHGLKCNQGCNGPEYVDSTSAPADSEKSAMETFGANRGQIIDDKGSEEAAFEEANNGNKATVLGSKSDVRTDQPLADRMRPEIWSDFVGQTQVRDILKELSSSGFLPSMILWGPPGNFSFAV
jgi:hypothetical protein